VADFDKATTNAADNMAKAPHPELEILVTITEGATNSTIGTMGKSSHSEGLQVSGEATTAIVEETSSSIADMIEELPQAGGSEVPMIEAGGASTSAEDIPEGPSQPEDSHERVLSPTLQPGEI